MATCPSCGAEVPADAKECPECGEAFDAAVVEAAKADGGKGRAGLREKLLFYLGVILVLVGGPGIALGSWLHDLLRIPIGGSAYDVFGPVNRFVAAIGLVVLVVGIVLLIFSLRFAKVAYEEEYDVGTPRKT